MPFSVDGRLVIGIASSAIFDLGETDAVFREKGEAAYRSHQREMVGVPLPRGHSLGFIRRLLALNDLSHDPEGKPLVEVILLSRNDPDTGLRVLESIKHHGLAITRAIFTQGACPWPFIPALNISLFLSGNREDVHEAIRAGMPAGHVMGGPDIGEEGDEALRIAFDFDGVLADDASEAIYQHEGIGGFHSHESRNSDRPHQPGPLKDFLVRLSAIQEAEEARRLQDPAYRSRVRISLVTARNAPSHRRAVETLKSWGVMANDAFFLGGIEKARVLGVLRPHIFFDDQRGHLEGSREVVPSVHIPFGTLNQGNSGV